MTEESWLKNRWLHLCPLFLDVLDEESNLHGSPDLVISMVWAVTWFLMVDTLLWYPRRVCIVTEFWITRKVMGMRGSTLARG